jgi:hypothetical protein
MQVSKLGDMPTKKKIDKARRLAPEQRLALRLSFSTLPPLSTALTARSVS